MYVCTRIRLCGFLTEKGFRYEKSEPNINNPKLKVWFFKDSPELQAAITEYYNRIQQQSDC